MTTPVSFELHNLLKEKGFVCKESGSFWMNGFSYLKKNYNPITYQDKDNVATIAEVVMWLYEKHGIWIETCYWESDNCFQWKIRSIFSKESFNQPIETYEAAIEYTLNNLI